MRYLPLSDEDRGEMLARIGAAGIDDLFADVPSDKLLVAPPDLPRRKGELDGLMSAEQYKEFLTTLE